MANNNTELVEALNKFISSYPNKIDKKNFLEAIKIVYSNKKQSKKSDSDKPKRAPTEYNLFMCSEMEKLKQENSKLTGKEKMEIIAKKWKEFKGKKEEDKKEEIQEEKEEIKEEEIKEEEVKKEEVKKEKGSKKK